MLQQVLLAKQPVIYREATITWCSVFPDLKDKLKKAYQDAGLKKTATGAQVTDYYTANEERRTINGKQVSGYFILGKKLSD